MPLLFKSPVVLEAEEIQYRSLVTSYTVRNYVNKNEYKIVTKFFFLAI